MLVIFEKQKGNIPEYVMDHAREKANAENIEDSTEEELRNIRTATRKQLKEIQQEAGKRREKEMKERVDTYIAKGKLPIGKALKIIIDQEKVRKEYSDIQRELDKKKFNALTRLIVPGEKPVDGNE